MYRLINATHFILRHFNVYGHGKHHGAATMFLFVGFFITAFYTAHETFSDEQAYLLVVSDTSKLSVDIVCGAEEYCRFISEGGKTLTLENGNTTTITASDSMWTIEALTPTRFTSKRVVLAIKTVEDELIYFPSVEQETLRFISLSKTVDRTIDPEHESWTVNDWGTYKEYPACRNVTPGYDGADSHTCGAFEIHFDHRMYIESSRPDINLALTILSSGALWVTLYAWLWYIVYGIDLVLSIEHTLDQVKRA